MPRQAGSCRSCRTLGVMNFIALSTTACLSFVAATAAASESVELSCPPFIHTRQGIVGDPPVGWSLPSAEPVENRLYLSGVQFFSGHPSELAILVPDNPHEFGTRRRVVQRWSFADTLGIYVSCQYVSTTVQLTQAVPPGFRRCEVSFERSRILGVVCKK
jgi:hypothetical protein